MQDELALLKYESDRCLQVLAFVPTDEVKRYQYMSGIDCVAAAPGDAEAQRALSAFAWSMTEMHRTALARYVARKNARPMLVALLPDIARADGSEALLLVQLPFADDIRDFAFPLVVFIRFDGGPSCILSKSSAVSSRLFFFDVPIRLSFIANVERGGVDVVGGIHVQAPTLEKLDSLIEDKGASRCKQSQAAGSSLAALSLHSRPTVMGRRTQLPTRHWTNVISDYHPLVLLGLGGDGCPCSAFCTLSVLVHLSSASAVTWNPPQMHCTRRG